MWKIFVKFHHFPRDRVENKKYLSCHHPEIDDFPNFRGEHVLYKAMKPAMKPAGWLVPINCLGICPPKVPPEKNAACNWAPKVRSMKATLPCGQEASRGSSAYGLKLRYRSTHLILGWFKTHLRESLYILFCGYYPTPPRVDQFIPCGIIWKSGKFRHMKRLWIVALEFFAGIAAEVKLFFPWWNISLVHIFGTWMSTTKKIFWGWKFAPQVSTCPISYTP